jgi:hypothetical protein
MAEMLSAKACDVRTAKVASAAAKVTDVTAAEASHVRTAKTAHVAAEAANVPAAKTSHVSTTKASTTASGLSACCNQASSKHCARQNHQHSSSHDILLSVGLIHPR